MNPPQNPVTVNKYIQEYDSGILEDQANKIPIKNEPKTLTINVDKGKSKMTLRWTKYLTTLPNPPPKPTNNSAFIEQNKIILRQKYCFDFNCRGFA